MAWDNEESESEYWRRESEARYYEREQRNRQLEAESKRYRENNENVTPINGSGGGMTITIFFVVILLIEIHITLYYFFRISVYPILESLGSAIYNYPFIALVIYLAYWMLESSWGWKIFRVIFFIFQATNIGILAIVAYHALKHIL